MGEWEGIRYGTGRNNDPGAPRGSDRDDSTRGRPFRGLAAKACWNTAGKGFALGGVVGVIATPDCQLEILPKIEGAGESDPEKAELRRRLIHMLAMAWNIRIDAGSLTQLGWQRDTILELLIRLFCGKLADAVRLGMPRQYIDLEDDLPALRGRLDVTRQFSDTRGLAAEARLPVRRALAGHCTQSSHAGGHRQALPFCPGSGQPARLTRVELRLRGRFPRCRQAPCAGT